MVCSCKGEKVVSVVVDWWGRRQGVAGMGWPKRLVLFLKNQQSKRKNNNNNNK
jgi:hypothetical protein